MTRLTTALLLLVTAVPSGATAQAVEAGSRLRVTMESPDPSDGPVRREVAFDRVEGDTLWVTSEEGSVPLPLDAAAPMAQTGESHGRVGAALGALAGVTLGALIGYAGYEPELVRDVRCDVPWPGAIPRNCQDYGTEDWNSRTVSTLGGASIGLILGTGFGWAIGRGIPRWVEVDVESFRAGPDGVAFAVSVATP